MDKPPTSDIVADLKNLTETGFLTIDLKAIAQNYQKLKQLAGKAECAAVVKADAYGLGADKVVPALIKVGCNTFFVATPHEGALLRKIDNTITIYVLDGLFPGTFEHFTTFNLRPVLNSINQIKAWSTNTNNLPAAIHVDTGMNRLGINAPSFPEAVNSGLLENLNTSMVVSHLACADEPEHPMNRQQLEAFQAINQRVPNIPSSLCNSAGILLGQNYQFDIVRPGIALYGGNPVPNQPNQMQPVVKLDIRIAQIRDVPANAHIGYGATQRLKRDSRIATLSLGYADGFFRHLSATTDQPGACLYVNSCKVPVVGRVSMDLVTIDITDVPEGSIVAGDLVEILGTKVGVDDIANWAGTIGYEVLTSLGKRYKRIYKN